MIERTAKLALSLAGSRRCVEPGCWKATAIQRVYVASVAMEVTMRNRCRRCGAMELRQRAETTGLIVYRDVHVSRSDVEVLRW